MQRSLLDDGILRVCSGMLLKSWRWAPLACRQLPCPVLQLVQSKTSWQSAIWIASYRAFALSSCEVSASHIRLCGAAASCVASGSATFIRFQHLIQQWAPLHECNTSWPASEKEHTQHESWAQKEVKKKIRKRYNAHYYTVKKNKFHSKNTVPYRAIFRYTALSIFSSCLRQASRALGPCPGAWSNGSLISLLFVDWPMNT